MAQNSSDGFGFDLPFEFQGGCDAANGYVRPFSVVSPEPLRFRIVTMRCFSAHDSNVLPPDLHPESWTVQSEDFLAMYQIYIEEGLQISNKRPKRKISARLRDDPARMPAKWPDAMLSAIMPASMS